MGSPDLIGEEKLKYLVKSMWLYEMAGVDFLEINESCPNTSHGKPQDDDLSNRLKYIKKNFLDKRNRKIPVIVKFSNDTEIEQIPGLLDLLFKLKYDGVNFGNTSTDYEKRSLMIRPKDKNLYSYFIKSFGGGVSGRPLKYSSLKLASAAAKYAEKNPPKQEFHVIRTGGIENWRDVETSLRNGISLVQWFTGYWESFAKHGHGLYKNMFKGK